MSNRNTWAQHVNTWALHPYIIVECLNSNLWTFIHCSNSLYTNVGTHLAPTELARSGDKVLAALNAADVMDVDVETEKAPAQTAGATHSVV